MNSIVVLTCERCGKKTRNPEHTNATIAGI